MEKIETALPGVYIIEPKLFGDHRGYFMETYAEERFSKLGFTVHFVQDNESFTVQKGTVRGLHFQNDPMSQCKLVRVLQGAVMDVAVDIRRGSPTYCKWVSVVLSEENKRMLFIPRGFAHGFVTLTDQVKFSYKVDNPYAPMQDRSVRYDDPDIGVAWNVSAPILSDRDKNAPLLSQSDCNFTFGG